MMSTPAAAISGLIRLSAVGPRLEKSASENPGSLVPSLPGGSAMAPTVTANCAAAGEPIVYRRGPSLPAATNGVIPAAAAWLTTRDVLSVPSKEPDDPRLMFRASMPYVDLFAITHSTPASTQEVCPDPWLFRTLAPTRLAPGATPCRDRDALPSPSPAMIEDTCVPWPL